MTHYTCLIIKGDTTIKCGLKMSFGVGFITTSLQMTIKNLF